MDYNKKQNTKQKIFEESMGLFSNKGFYAVSIRDIVKEVGIKESSFYNHYKSKDTLLEDMLHLISEEFKKTVPPIEILDSIIESSTLEGFLTKGLQNYKEFIQKPFVEKIWRILQMEQYRNEQATQVILNDIFYNMINFLEEALRRFMEQQKMVAGDPALLAREYQYPMFSMVYEYNILRFSDLDTTKLEGFMDYHVRLFSKRYSL